MAKPHILIFPFPAQGHLLPLLDFTHQLALRSFTISIIVTPKNLQTLNPLLAAHPNSVHAVVFPLPSHPKIPPGVENVKDLGNSGNIPIVSALSNLRDPIIHWFQSHPSPPIAIVSDFFLGWTLQLARRLNIPRISFYSSGAFLTAVNNFLWLNMEAVRDRKVVEFSEIPGTPSFKEEHLPSTFRTYRESDPDWEIVKQSRLDDVASWGFVFNTFHSLEASYLDHLKSQLGNSRVFAVGPVSLLGPNYSADRGSPYPDSINRVFDFLNGSPNGSVLYVCFGSQKLLNREQMEALASGLEISETRFVWVVKTGTAQQTEEGYGAIPEGFEDRVSGRGIVIKGWVPQVAILGHGAVGGFVSHCGWNSALESIVAGVMIVGWPMEADQFVNARLLVEEKRVAVRLCEGADSVPDPDEMGRVIRRSMGVDSPEKVRALELRDEALKAVTEVGKSFKELDDFVEALRTTLPEKDMDSAMEKYPGELTFRVLMICVMAASGGLIFGYDHGVSGGVTSMDSFLKEFFPSVYEKESNMKHNSNTYCKFDSQILTLFTSSLYLTALIAGLAASLITRMMGRRATMILGGLFFVAGALFNGFAISIWMLILGRMLLGFGIGCANQSVPIYVSEMAPYKYRGALNMCFQLSITIGIFISSLFNYYFVNIMNGHGWRLSLGLGAVPAVIFVIGSLCLPDSPSSLIEHGRLDEARKVLMNIRGTPYVDAEFNDIVAASEASKLVKHPWKTLRQRKYRPQLVMAVCIPFFQQFTGLNVITFYAPILFRSIGFGSKASLLSSMIIGSCKPVSTFISILLVDKCGRRTLFLEGGAQMLICQIIMTIAIGLQFGTSGNPGQLPEWYAYVVVGVICIYVAGFAWSWGPLGWLVPSEVFSLEVRPAAQSITVAVNMISTFLIAQFFTSMLCHFKFGLFIFFGCFVVIMTTFVYKLVPETKGIPIEEMSKVWEKHPFWCRFVQPNEGTEMTNGRSKC